MKQLCCLLEILAILAVSCCLMADEFKLEKGFLRLDNGKDLTGWTGDKTGWSVVDGAIHLDCKKARASIYSEKTHGKDLVIRLQFRAAPGADSGVFIHGSQLQVRDSLRVGPKRYASAAKPAGQWSELEFDIRHGVARVKLNGKLIEKAWKTGNAAGQGIGLQREIGDFDFRYVRLKERGSPVDSVR